jgi:hypothetical protein
LSGGFACDISGCSHTFRGRVREAAAESEFHPEDAALIWSASYDPERFGN